jgi:hypothetical protein
VQVVAEGTRLHLCLLQLFQHEPSHGVPVAAPAPGFAAVPSGNLSPTGFGSQPHEHNSTLDEPVWQTILRDVRRIYANLVLVVFPFKNRDQQHSALRNWDLWGPMVSQGGCILACRTECLIQNDTTCRSSQFQHLVERSSAGACMSLL